MARSPGPFCSFETSPIARRRKRSRRSEPSYLNLPHDAIIVRSADATEIRIATTLDLRVGFVAGDSERIQQIAWNLLSKAVKFTPNGGRVHVWLIRVDSHEISVADTWQR